MTKEESGGGQKRVCDGFNIFAAPLHFVPLYFILVVKGTIGKLSHSESIAHRGFGVVINSTSRTVARSPYQLTPAASFCQQPTE